MKLPRRIRIAVCVIALGLAAPVAQAANMADWWIYVANDKDFDIKPLLDQGANPNRRTDAGQPAIMQAMRDHAWKTYDLLAADPRTDVNATNKQNETPLMFLAILGETETAGSRREGKWFGLDGFALRGFHRQSACRSNAHLAWGDHQFPGARWHYAVDDGGSLPQ
jgi:hypothetical protein